MPNKPLLDPPGTGLWRLFSLTFLFLGLAREAAYSQETQIRGFVHVEAGYRNDTKNAVFSLGEQDLFITSELSDRISFLGETVFRPYSTNDATLKDVKSLVSIERIILNYNYYRNHNVLFGKHHTPVNFWNDSYHHGRVFFPTIFRPMMFDQGIIPLHTTGVRFQGQNLGSIRFGYDFMVGNGVASDDLSDKNLGKSITAAVNCKPFDKFKVGLSYYFDEIPKGTLLHHSSIRANKNVTQHMGTVSVSYFSNRFEFLGESSTVINKNDSTGSPLSTASYAYIGYKYKKFVPYLKGEYLSLNKKEVLFANHDQYNFLVGLRYEVNYLTVLKLELARTQLHTKGAAMTTYNAVNFQFAVGF